MEEKQEAKKMLRVLMVIMVAIIIPGLMRTLNSAAFELVRNVDILMLFAAGMATGVLIVTIKNYFSIKNKKQQD